MQLGDRTHICAKIQGSMHHGGMLMTSTGTDARINMVITMMVKNTMMYNVNATISALKIKTVARIISNRAHQKSKNTGPIENVNQN